MSKKEKGPMEATSETVPVPGQVFPATPAAAKQPRDKAASFVRLADRRVTRALKEIQAIANLGNRSQYTYTAEQYERLFDALVNAVEGVRHSFSGKTQQKSMFSVNG